MKRFLVGFDKDGFALQCIEGVLECCVFYFHIHAEHSSKSWHRRRIVRHEDNLHVVLCQLQQLFYGFKRHELNVWDDDGRVVTCILHFQTIARWFRIEEIAVGNVVHVVAMLDDALDGFNKLRSTFIHGMNVEQSDAIWLFIYHVIEWQINEKVVVGLSPLQERLAALDVLAECR